MSFNLEVIAHHGRSEAAVGPSVIGLVRGVSARAASADPVVVLARVFGLYVRLGCTIEVVPVSNSPGSLPFRLSVYRASLRPGTARA